MTDRAAVEALRKLLETHLNEADDHPTVLIEDCLALLLLSTPSRLENLVERDALAIDNFTARAGVAGAATPEELRAGVEKYVRQNRALDNLMKAVARLMREMNAETASDSMREAMRLLGRT